MRRQSQRLDETWWLFPALAFVAFLIIIGRAFGWIE